MPGMPYHLEKGVWGAVFEDFLNGGETPQRALETLQFLRTNTTSPLTDLPFFSSTTLDNPHDLRYGGEGPEVRTRHFLIDWMGWGLAKTGNGGGLQGPLAWIEAFDQQMRKDDDPALSQIWEDAVAEFTSRPGDEESIKMARLIDTVTKHELYDLVNHYPETGFWHQYHGNVEQILRETFASAIELALGLDWREGKLDEYLDSPDKTPSRLPIEIFWKCPQRWFEGWVTWRTDPVPSENTDEPGGGQVTVIIATPGSGTPLLERPGFSKDALTVSAERWAEPPPPPAISYVPARRGKQPAKGMWVISHEDHVNLPPPNTWKRRPFGQFSVPPFGPSYIGTGNVVVIEPSEFAGGVSGSGQSFMDAGRVPRGDPELKYRPEGDEEETKVAEDVRRQAQ